MNWTNIYAAISDGKRVYADIKKCNIHVDGKAIKMDESKEILDHIDSIIEIIEYLYGEYKNSVPNESNIDSKYFKAKLYKDLTLNDLVNGEDRYKARQKLESFIVFIKAFRKEDILDWFGDRFFWQSEEDPELILLKSWFE